MSLINSDRKKRWRKMLLCGRPWVECHYCGKRLIESKLTLDHVVPLSKGGARGMKNIVACCVKCNTRRGNTDYAVFVKRIAA